MRLVCPSCTATYEVADAIMPQSGQVQCARCGTAWQTHPPASEPPATKPPATKPPATKPPAIAGHPAIAEPVAPVPSPAPERLAPPLPEPAWTELKPAGPAAGQRRNILAGWALSVAVIVILVAMVFIFRADIQRVWPPSARIFQLFEA